MNAFQCLTVAALLTFISQPEILRAQGSLTPPGAPAPTMKTLAQIEPRIPIGTNTTPGDADNLFKITQPGSYYLTTNLTGVASKYGIGIYAPGVTLDLMGFEMVGSNSFSGIFLQYENVVIRNGTIRNWSSGISGNASNCRYEDLRLIGNHSHGLPTGDSCIIINCAASGNTNDGFQMGRNNIARDCTAQGNGWTGFTTGAGCALENCEAFYNTLSGFQTYSTTLHNCAANQNQADGISAGSDSIISHCEAGSNTGFGINAYDITFFSGGTIDQCLASYNQAGGIRMGNKGVITGCQAFNNNASGISTSNGCNLTSCSSFGNSASGFSTGSGCTITGCTARTNLVDGIIAAFGCTIRSCTASDNRNDGIQATSGGFIAQNDCYNNGVGTNDGAGIHITGNNNRVDENHVSFADRGIEVGGIDNLITRNSVSFTSTNFLIGNLNKVGVIVAAPYSGAISGNTGGAGVGTTDPWANLSTP